MPYYCPGGKNGKIETIRFLGTVKSLFYQNTSSARKKLKKNKTKQNKDITFTKKVWKTIVPGGGGDTLICFLLRVFPNRICENDRELRMVAHWFAEEMTRVRISTVWDKWPQA